MEDQSLNLQPQRNAYGAEAVLGVLWKADPGSVWQHSDGDVGGSTAWAHGDSDGVPRKSPTTGGLIGCLGME
ncbi:hypothetical protein EYF80_061345 [Liparis tanakae]|uniref:Uncharacterized protein n=1 Tax=Liparis tanakae TaxID=230148 RepID=A0A4Z2EI37_9TELE|nr:hypothetical protein EYF80_061345 [Liparis tanakae]